MMMSPIDTCYVTNGNLHEQDERRRNQQRTTNNNEQQQQQQRTTTTNNNEQQHKQAANAYQRFTNERRLNDIICLHHESNPN